VAVTLEEVVRLYLDSESRPTDREAGGRQPKRKRGWKGDSRSSASCGGFSIVATRPELIAARAPGRPKARDPNHHRTLVNGKWIFRLCRYGRDITQATRCPKREVVTARAVRDKLLAEFSVKRFGVGDA
jgi:hypothetical protein